MNSEKCNIAWNNFENCTTNIFKDLLSDKHFTDVILVCEDGKHQIEAHKFILSSCSSFFSRILVKNPHQKPLLYLKGVKFEDLEQVMNFVYRGQAELAQEDVQRFLLVAKDLKIEGLDQDGSLDYKYKDSKNPFLSGFEDTLEPCFFGGGNVYEETKMMVKGDKCDNEFVNNEELYNHEKTVYEDTTSWAVEPVEGTLFGIENEESGFYTNYSEGMSMKRRTNFKCTKCDQEFTENVKLCKDIKDVHEAYADTNSWAIEQVEGTYTVDENVETEGYITQTADIAKTDKYRNLFKKI